ncbi:hypothetical protein JCM5353_003074 [Sporobolomyces roseus]
MPKHPLTCLRFKLSKTTIFLPVDSKATLSSLRETLLSALQATPDSSIDLPKSSKDIALWRLEPSEQQEVEDGEEKWIKLSDEKSTADKLGLSEAEEVGVSFKGPDGKYPKPKVERPREDEDEEMPQ